MIKTFSRNLLDISILFKINLILTTILYLIFLTFNDSYSFLTLLFMIFAAISTSATLYLLFFILIAPFAYFYRVALYGSAALFVFTNLALIVDFFIFRIWKFHINSMVLNIIFSPESMDSIQTGLAPILAVIFIVIFFVTIEFYLIKKILSISYNTKKNFNTNANKRLLPILFLIIFVDKVAYGFANMYAKREYLEPTNVLPLYQPMDFTRTMERTFGLHGVKKNKESLAIKSDKKINYPLHEIKIENANKKNIFIFALDSVRASILSKEVAPYITNFSKSALNFNNNISGGNATRFGIFSLLYGLNSSYWFVFLNAQKGSVLFDTLNKLHYQTHIFASASLVWPEFRKTVFYDIQNKISDKHEGIPYQKDMQTTDEFLQWIDEVNTSKPIFSFVFLDAPHGQSYPETNRVFLPDHYGEVNYLTMTSKDREPLLNKYKNSINFTDKLVKKMIEKLKQKGLYKDSIIIITADHGQEFYEFGRYGHNSAFNYEQVKVPFIVHLPNQTQYREITKLTSNIDLVPTLMSYIGVSNTPNDYSNGQDLFSDSYMRTQAYIGNWNDNGILTDKYIYVFSNMPDKIFDNKIYDTKTYEEVNPKDSNKQQVILKALNENSKFIK
ncbi:sulfatase-like hydrolase/transferase [Sulfurimonas sp.]